MSDLVVHGDNTPSETPERMSQAERDALIAKLEAAGITREHLVAAGIVSLPERKSPRVQSAKLNDAGGLSLEVCANEVEAIDAALGSTSPDYQTYAMTHLVNIMRGGQPKSENYTLDLNAALAMLAGIDPQNELEAMLAAQMVMTHHTATRQLTKHHYSEMLETHQAHGNLANKLLRTFTMQVEALAKLRRGGKQIVEHVHVYPGGQAVIADTVHTGGRK